MTPAFRNIRAKPSSVDSKRPARSTPSLPVINAPSLSGSTASGDLLRGSANRVFNVSLLPSTTTSKQPTLIMDDKVRRSARQHSEGSTATTGDKMKDSKSPDASLAIRTNSKRLRREPSTVSLASRVTKASKKAKIRPNLSRNSSAISVQSRPGVSRNSSVRSVRSAKHLLIPGADDAAITSGDEGYEDSVMSSSLTGKPVIAINLDEPMNEKPEWAVRHRIYVDNELISTTTSMHRPGYHKFQDLLLREQIEVRLHTPHHGENAHFATRHATLRFWLSDGSLAEKWMDKDMGGQQEHEFAMENLNDWTIVYLSMGGEDTTSDSDSEADAEMSVNQTDTETAEEAFLDDDDQADNDDISNPDEVFPTMDIISHYISDYHDARNIASAPGISLSDAASDNDAPSPKPSPDDETKDRPTLDRQNSTPIYHWVEERRRSLEHQLRTYYHCPSPSCFNKGGTCLVLSPSSQHLHVGVKDLTDWSQQIAHANRSIAATTLHLAAKLVDDQTRAQGERLADVGREREDEDDLGEVIRGWEVLGRMRPGGLEAGVVDMEMLE
ncbi:hypothetical protein CAC42_3393 [Sphaceloma murrayae]|uniref:Uncharacterized protein n=1 Tax=Sphaceloma murrayae TaxID=2082308 RepID=A0A2K1R187_9PEZI|nr:hypothetical protein CAC42_3393 [Sphaceloma murrayae]